MGTADHSDFAVAVESKRALNPFADAPGSPSSRIFPGLSMSQQARSRLLELFKQRAFSFGDFTLASGKKSSYYINSKKAIFHSEAVALLGELLWEATRDLHIQAMGGLEVGAIPMTTAAVMRYHQEGKTLEGFLCAKRPKGTVVKSASKGCWSPGCAVRWSTTC
jgi:hypothetical protein